MSSHRRTGCSGLRGVRPPQSRGRTMRVGASCCCLTFVRAGVLKLGDGRGRRCRRRRVCWGSGSHDFAAARACCGSACVPFTAAYISSAVRPRHEHSAAAVTPPPRFLPLHSLLRPCLPAFSPCALPVPTVMHPNDALLFLHPSPPTSSLPLHSSSRIQTMQ